MVDQVIGGPRPDRRCYALTGGPGVGKTALLDHLGSMGYSTVREAARDVIHEQLLLDSDVLPWRDQSTFQRHVLELQLKRESIANGPVVFMDRGVPDGIAYLRAYGLSVFREMLVHARERYDGVFLIESHGEYADDAERREDPEEALMLHGVIEATYRDLGYELVSVPSMPVARRSEFVLERIGAAKITTEITETTTRPSGRNQRWGPTSVRRRPLRLCDREYAEPRTRRHRRVVIPGLTRDLPRDRRSAERRNHSPGHLAGMSRLCPNG